MIIDEPIKNLIRNTSSDNQKLIERIKDDNRKIKSKITVEIEKVIDYLEELKDGKHIDYQASDKYPDLFDLNKHLVGGCVRQAARLKSIIESIETDSENLDYLFSISLPLKTVIKDYDEGNYYLMPNDLAVTNASLFSMESFITALKRDKDNYSRVITDEIRNIILHADDEISRFRRIRNIADNAKTENIYDQAVMRYRTLEVDYRNLFYLSIGITLIFSILVFSLKGQLVPNFFSNIEFWAIKISLLAVGITLITYFLKQSTHYQRLADQNYQTQVELQAYPSFMESIPTEEAASVRKELALKYFGREIDGAAHKDMSNLISDQMKSTTEMVKAATDVLKAKG